MKETKKKSVAKKTTTKKTNTRGKKEETKEEIITGGFTPEQMAQMQQMTGMMFQTFMDVDRGIRAGNDCFLAGLPALGKLPDLSNNTAKQAARKCAHNILYSVANARATNVSLNDSWLNWFIPLDVILFVLLLAWGGFVSYKAFKFNRKETVEITEAETDKK